MARRKYPAQTDGKWVQPSMRDFRMACCDCGLVHVLDFRVVRAVNASHQRTVQRGSRVQFRASRDMRKTAALRREGGKRGDYPC